MTRLTRSTLAACVFVVGCRVGLEEPVSRVVKEECKVLDLAVCNAAEGQSSFEYVFTKVLSSNCTGSGCHQEGSTDPNAELLRFDDRALAHASIVNVDSRISPGAPENPYKIIDPGKPASSYMLFLMHAISEEEFVVPAGGLPIEDPPPDIGFMPRSNSALCCQKLDAVEAWVAAGAPID